MAAVVMAGKELVCVNKFGRLLVNAVQVVRNSMIPRRYQVMLCCRINCRRTAELGVVEGMHGRI